MMRHTVGILVLSGAIGTVAWGADDVLTGADARIRAHRMGDLTITVKDTGGKPIPGARVEIEQIRHEFLFGSNIFSTLR